MIGQTQYFRDTWAEIDLDALYQNVKTIRDGLPQETNLFAAVKANAYGHGDFQIAKEALKAGAHGLVVALLDEALALRQKGIKAPILVLGLIRPTDAVIAARHHISVPVFQVQWLKEASQAMEGGEPPLKIHVKCDTGMGRIGLKHEEELKEIEQFIQNTAGFEFEGIFTHFSTADQASEEYYQKQLAVFKKFVSVLETVPKYVHAANSAGALCHDDSLFNAVRVGIALYGLCTSQERPTFNKGKQIFSLHTRIVHVKKIQPGECIGYGAAYQAEKEEWIATIPVGYADGWLRKLEGQSVIADGQRADIVGRICMDQTMVRLPHFIPIGTKVTLIGGQETGDFITVEEIAEKLETINYEVTCTINFRVPRIYKRGGQQVEVENKLFLGL
ncbi:MAG TPA: alanine racemase [Bacillus bacterium]|uniref:Alanine racemase n=1 Tax=Siminovitchia fordii TaxID=254759 RepID=A0ABQ4K8X8_9BACI|nr:alanine racemase [Siminovitchia fordii]GIN22163.1 alanine racemase [Siminovitchia fordii]HBZ09921.1 alanine racemase [Bacillus sp. (in: firmicutes)]